MKKAIQILMILVVILLPIILSAQPLPGDNTIGGGAGSAPTGGGAPLGGGLLIMLSLALGYGTKKLVQARKKLLE